MNSPMFSRILCAAPISQLSIHSAPQSPVPIHFPASRVRPALHWRLASAIALLALAFAPLQIASQQSYPQSPYGYSNPYPQQNAQPQYQQPQYAPQQPYTQQPYEQASPSPDLNFAPPPAAPVQALSAADLEQLLAPIALYPDALLAQILAASTYPAQVSVADQWLQQMRSQGYGSPDQIAAGATTQTSWDPSIKALTAFPDVLDMLNHNLEWTTNLGNAYYNQPQDVMQTAQVLRQRAQQAGNLQSTPQEDVTSSQGYINLAPPNPEQVYVPTYNPWDVYGQPISPYPGFSLSGALGDFFGSSPIEYGLSFALGAFQRTPFGLFAWGLDWLANSVLFDHSDYYSRSTTVADWGLPRGGPRAFYGRGGEYGRGGTERWARNGYDNRNWGGQHSNDRGNWSGNQRGDWNSNQRGDQRGEWSNNRSIGQSFVRPAAGVPYQPRSNEFNRGNQPSANSFTHPAVPARQMYDRAAPQVYGSRTQAGPYASRPQVYPNRAPAYASRLGQAFDHPANKYGYGNRSSGTYAGQAYATRPGFAFANPTPSYRPPQATNNSRAFSGRSYAPNGSSMSRNDRSGGFHLFGGNNSSKAFSGGRAPSYSYKAPRSFGGFGGGHEKAPSFSHSSGGHFGGGGHSSGGHSSGGGGNHHH